VLDHVGFQCADLAASAAFYDAVLQPLGGSRLMDFEVAIGYGTDHPDFWIGVLSPPAAANPGEDQPSDGFRESHIAFGAASRAHVDAFFQAAVATGAQVLHEPRVHAEYHEHYYAAFVRDPDGNNVEAVCHRPE
jgi:catechol 2,3-dioxygenase-like lactoylglutathione lyase family enzyme